MKSITILLLLFLSDQFFAQRKRLFAKVIHDTIVSIVDEDGRVIIKPFRTFYGYGHNSEIKDDFFYVFDRDNQTYASDREGNILFYPFYFDNGPDYFWEETTRITYEKNKVGIADKHGKIIVSPKYDFMHPFEMGYAFYCIGCYLDRKKDEEHPPLVNTDNFGYVDRNGREVQYANERKHPKDIEIGQGKFLPYAFSYNEKEELILKKFYTNIKKIASKLYYDENDKITFEIISRPSEDYPFYFVKLYHSLASDFDDAHGSNFKVSENGKIYWVYEYPQIDKDQYEDADYWILLDDWLNSKD